MTLLRHDLPQGDDAWLALRAGKLTSTGAKCILPLAALTGEGKADIAKTRQSYLWKLVAERLSGVPVKDGFTNDAMERGSRVEPEARAAYAAWCGDDPYIDTPGFLEIEGQWWGDSPDGVIYGPDGAIARTVELKCPEGYNHMTWRDAGRVPNEYLRQCVHHLAVLGTAERCDFVSFHPAFPGKLGLFVAALGRDAQHPKTGEKLVDIYRKAAVEFLEEVAHETARRREEM
jgi:hypothetical protein